MASIDIQHSVSIRSGFRIELGTIAMDASYPTNGESLSPGGDRGWWKAFVAPSAGYVPSWDAAAQKLKVYRQSAATGALTEVPNATDLSAVSFDVIGFRS